METDKRDPLVKLRAATALKISTLKEILRKEEAELRQYDKILDNTILEETR